MLRMIVEGIGFDHLRKTVVVLKDWDGRKLLPIWVDAAQARAIGWELDGIHPPRPGSHDLLIHCIRLAQGHITRVVINDLQNMTFFATLDIDTPRGLIHIDARPSDALALAVRAKCPVFVDGGALEALIDIEDGTIVPSSTAENIEDDISDAEEQPFEPDDDPLAASAPAPPTLWNAETPSPLAQQEEINRFKRLLDDLSEE